MTTKGLTSSMKRPIRQLAIREKIEAIDRVHTGESKASVARDIGVPESTLRGWCKSEEKLRTVARTCGTPDSQHSEPDKDNADGRPDRKRARSEEFNANILQSHLPDMYNVPNQQPEVALNMSIAHPPEIALNMTKSQLNQNQNTPKKSNPPYQLLTPQSLLAATGPAKTQPEVDEALWYWLKQQQQTTLGSSLTGLDKDGSWFWRWYKNFGYSQYSDLAVPKAEEGHVVAPRSNGHPDAARSALDEVLLNVRDDNVFLDNNNVRKLDESDDDDEDEPPATAAEAVGHGEKFLRWLECCSDPSVTAMQILQFRYLLNNVRACADRRAKHVKTNTRSRRK